MLCLAGASGVGAAAVLGADATHVLAAEAVGTSASDPVTDCRIQYSGLDVLPPNSSYFAYNPTMVAHPDEGRFVGISRVQMVLNDNFSCQMSNATNYTDVEQLQISAQTLFCRWTRGMDQSRDLLVEWESPLESPCEARFVRLLGEGEDPRLFHGASGATLATYEHFQAWTVDGIALQDQLALRPLLMTKWGSELLGGEDGVMPASARLVTSGAHASSAVFLTRAMMRNASVFGADRLDMWGVMQGLMTSCDAFEDVPHAKCSHNGGYLNPSYANYTRAPVACNLEYKAAMKTHEAKLDRLKRKRRRAKHAVSLGAFTNGVGFFSDKNWSPMQYEGKDYMVTWLEPFTTCTFEGDVQDTFKLDTLNGTNATFKVYNPGSRKEEDHVTKYVSRPVSTMGCARCKEVSSISNSGLATKLIDHALERSVTIIEETFGLPRPEKLQPKDGQDGIHLNGVPFIKVKDFAGHDEAFLGVAHMITQAGWVRNWTQAMEDAMYGATPEVQARGEAYLEASRAAAEAGESSTFIFTQEPTYDGIAVVSNYSAGEALMYQHYYTLSSAKPPFQLLDIASTPLPLQLESSPQPWFETCDDLKDSINWWKKWNTTHDAACGLSIAFVSGFERVKDDLFVSYGVGDSKSHLLSMPVSHAETYFSA